jgi:hypothetical protein
MLKVEPVDGTAAELPSPELTTRNTAEVLPVNPGSVTEASIISAYPAPTLGTGN